jgi:hypothetical protein
MTLKDAGHTRLLFYEVWTDDKKQWTAILCYDPTGRMKRCRPKRSQSQQD